MLKLEEVKMHFHSKKGIFSTEKVKAIDGVSLEIEKGKTLSVVGESGSGKTTLGKITLRLLRPTAGRVYFEETDITDMDDKNLKTFRRRAQAVFQDPYSSIDPFMNVFQIIEEPLVIHKIGNKETRFDLVKKTLENVKLVPSQDYIDKYPHMLSGGQRQRVGIARALVLNPDYILTDEPVSMIDASSRVEILNLLNNLQNKYNLTFMYITHDIATAKYFSDRIAVMYSGRIVEIGPPEKVVQNPLHPYTARLISAVPEPNALNRFRERGVMEGEPPSAINLPKGCGFEPRCDSRKNDCQKVVPELIEVEKDHFFACYKEKKSEHLILENS
jgi:peptide/nickel transport system ATP-binding protein